MTEMTVTDFARNLRKAFDRVEHRGEEIVLVRNKHRIARIVPGLPQLDAIEAMGDLYRTLPESAAATWVSDGRLTDTIEQESRNAWDS